MDKARIIKQCQQGNLEGFSELYYEPTIIHNRYLASVRIIDFPQHFLNAADCTSCILMIQFFA